MKIYTKTGDAGKTSLIGGTKVLKSDDRINAYGTVDELNSFVGMASDYCTDQHSKEILKEIQDRLFTIGSELACDPHKQNKMRIPDLHENDIELLEKEMDRMDAELPPLKNFILPGGHLSSSSLHLARSVCRRAERCCVKLQDKEESVSPLIIKYINRLSDYFFMLSRYMSMKNNAPEIAWKARV
ncbi:MAG: cob(I)yrinic acid a,c-diamide adenosyltransferase [Ginsengibacter sp.]|jgi:cob(I)alamin adenosyltransferase